MIRPIFAQQDEEPLPLEPESATEPAPPAEEEIQPEVPLPESKVKESRLSVDLAAVGDYTFQDTLDHYGIKYHLKIDCPKITWAKRLNTCSGKADITTEVDGFLAKGGTIECKLQTIPGEAPYEINLIRTDENRCTIKIKLSKTIVEDWTSICLFLDDPSAKFVTRGEPEKLLQAAIDKITPSLESLSSDDCSSGNATLGLTVPEFKIEEKDLGYWSVSGLGSLAFEPIPEEEEKTE